MVLRGFLLPEHKLYQLIEMCMTVGLEPESFGEQSASCDAETLARWQSEEWIEEDSAEELRGIFRDGLKMLAADWGVRVDHDRPTEMVTMRRERVDGGVIEACVLDLEPAVQTELLALLSNAAGNNQIEIAAKAEREIARTHGELMPNLQTLRELNELFMPHSLFPHRRVSPARRLGPRSDGCGLSFMLAIELFAHSFHGIPELTRRAGEDPALLELAALLRLGCAQRLAWVGAAVLPLRMTSLVK